MSQGNLIEDYLVTTLGEDYQTVLFIGASLANGESLQLPKFTDDEIEAIARAAQEKLTVAQLREVQFRKDMILSYLYHLQGTNATEVQSRRGLNEAQDAAGKLGKSKDASAQIDFFGNLMQQMQATQNKDLLNSTPRGTKALNANEQNTENIAHILAIGLNSGVIPEEIVQRIRGVLGV